jgi:PAS domain S-box-containing protein
MTHITQSPDQLNAAILSWTHELAPHGIFTTDRDLRITSWNRWLENHSSLRADQIVGRPLLDLIPSLTERRLDDYFADALRGEVKVLSRALHGYLLPFPPPIHGSGFERMQQSARIAPLLFEGQVCGTITVIEDVTERESQAAVLRASEERFRIMADTVPDIIFTTDAEGRFEFLNHRFYEITGRPPGSGIGSDWLNVTYPDEAERVRAARKESLQTGSPYTAEVRMRVKDASYRWFMTRAWPVCDESQRVVRWFGASTDVHDLKETQLALAKAEAELKNHAAGLEQAVAERTAKLRETIAQLESFSYTVAHDLRAPIRAMESYSQILLQELGAGLDDEHTKMLTNIGRAARHLDALTRDLLNYTKVSTQDVRLESVQVEDVLHNVTAMNPALHAPHSLIAVVRPLHPVVANPTLLGQSFSNLLDNAVKFVAPNVIPRIVIRSEIRDAIVRLWIEDNGIGMDMGAERKIFGIFERARSANDYPGTGIGLAIVAKAVERMRGSYGVDSELNKGSRFWIELPSAS